MRDDSAPASHSRHDADRTPWEKRLHLSSVRALYLHIPFCARKCAYCDFASRETARGDASMERYVDLLCEQLRQVAGLALLEGCETAYLGGGTPSLLGPELLGRLVRAVSDAAPQLLELTCEANPDSLTDDVLAALVAAGATRLSIGVQSLQDEELTALGRLHDARTARERVRAAVASGLDVSLDLMCATPKQTDASWRDTLEQALSLGVGHVSVYPLQIEEDTPLGQAFADDDPDWNDPELQARRMLLASDLLSSAGFVRYEVASYARPGKACRHNQAYWTGLPYLGLGAASASMLTPECYARLRQAVASLPELGEDVTRVRLSVASGLSAGSPLPPLSELACESEFLTEAQAAAEDLMLGMRLSRGVGQDQLAYARTVLDSERLEKTIDHLLSRGLVRWQGERLAVTREGWLLGNEVFSSFWDLSQA